MKKKYQHEQNPGTIWLNSEENQKNLMDNTVTAKLIISGGPLICAINYYIK